MEPLYSFEISRALLQAMALFQSGDDTRFVLNSTKFELIEQGGHNELTLASTDGRRMAVYRLQILADSLLTALPEAAEFSIDLSGVKKLPKVRGIAGCFVTCEGEGWGCGFGGYVFDSPAKIQTAEFRRVGTAYGMEFILRVLSVVGVDEWEKLKGQHVRVKTEGPGGRIKAIGHITKNKWFCPDTDMGEFTSKDAK